MDIRAILKLKNVKIPQKPAKINFKFQSRWAHEDFDPISLKVKIKVCIQMDATFINYDIDQK